MVIYVIAEERTGSTWVANQLAVQLDRSHAYIETSTDDQVNANRIETIKHNLTRYSDNGKVYQTHLFELLGLEWPEHPLVIRTARKNVLEQMLSYFIALNIRQTGEWIVHTTLLEEPITLTKAQIEDYLSVRALREQQWNDYQGPKQVIFYEDLFDVVKVTALDLKLSFDQPSFHTKLRYEKHLYFSNFKEIKKEMQGRGLV